MRGVRGSVLATQEWWSSADLSEAFGHYGAKRVALLRLALKGRRMDACGSLLETVLSVWNAVRRECQVSCFVEDALAASDASRSLQSLARLETAVSVAGILHVEFRTFKAGGGVGRRSREQNVGAPGHRGWGFLTCRL